MSRDSRRNVKLWDFFVHIATARSVGLQYFSTWACVSRVSLVFSTLSRCLFQSTHYKSCEQTKKNLRKKVDEIWTKIVPTKNRTKQTCLKRFNGYQFNSIETIWFVWNKMGFWLDFTSLKTSCVCVFSSTFFLLEFKVKLTTFLRTKTEFNRNWWGFDFRSYVFGVSLPISWFTTLTKDHVSMNFRTFIALINFAHFFRK